VTTGDRTPEMRSEFCMQIIYMEVAYPR